MKFRGRFITDIIQFAGQQGLPKQSLLHLTGKSWEELSQEDCFCEASIYNSLIESIYHISRNQRFGLHLGNYLSLSAAGLIVQIAQSSQTVKEALHYMVEFANLGCQAMPFRLEEASDAWKLSLHPHPLWLEQSPISVRQTMDGTMVFTIREFHSLTRQRYQPLKVHFCYKRPTYFKEYEAFFKCPIRFDQVQTAIFLDKKQVESPVRTNDIHLLRLLVQYAEEKLRKLSYKDGFGSLVRQSIINMARPQFPSIQQVAANLNISIRTLQRRLGKEGINYKTLMDGLRQQFALDYLRNEQLSIKEIAYLLDYADTSSFIRSFKRWKGLTPVEYRKSKGEVGIGK
ncbi:MAG: AraC family transcriptional regulator ligand-binding domain-containing protein [Bacteroidota bacterium]